MAVDKNDPARGPNEVADRDRQRMLAVEAAKADRDEQLRDMETAGETPFERALRVSRAQAEEAEREEQRQVAMQAEVAKIRGLAAKVADHDKFVFQIQDLQNEVNDLIVENEHLKVQVGSAQGLAMAASNHGLEGAGMIGVDNGHVHWRYDKEDFGWFKQDGNKLWVYNGKIIGPWAAWSTDSVALTLGDADTEIYVYVRQNRVSGLSATVQGTAFPGDDSTFFTWPLLRMTQKDEGGGGDYTWEVSDVYNTGFVYEKRVVPDGNNPYASRKKSLQFRGDGTGNNWDVEIWSWHNPSTSVPVQDDLFVYQDVSDTNLELKYLTLANLGQYLDIPPQDSWVNVIEYPDTWYKKWYPNPDFNECIAGELNDCNLITHYNLDAQVGNGTADFEIGGGAENDNHDKRYFKFATATGAAEAKDFKTSGFVYAATLGVDAGATNNWTNAAFNTDLSGDATIGAANVRLDPATDIYYGAQAGVQSIPNWINLGGMVGTSIIEIDASDLRPTDKILVVR